MNKITIDHFQRVQFLSALALSPAGSAGLGADAD